MLLLPLTLQDLNELSAPEERVSLAEAADYAEAESLLGAGGFESYRRIESSVQGGGEPFELLLVFFDAEVARRITVKVAENQTRHLQWTCDHCVESGRFKKSCRHRWAALKLLWSCLHETKESALNLSSEFHLLRKQLRADLQKQLGENEEAGGAGFENSPELRAISLNLQEVPLSSLTNFSVTEKTDLDRSKKIELNPDRLLLSPRLWGLPEVFNKKLTAFSENFFNEVNQQIRLADVVQYHFTDGSWLSSREILRHPLHKKIKPEWLPLSLEKEALQPAGAKWPLLPRLSRQFISQGVSEVEAVMQNLLNRLMAKVGSSEVKIYLCLQSSEVSYAKYLLLNKLDYLAASPLYWRVSFTERPDLKAEFQLMPRGEYVFFPSFALNTKESHMYIHSWAQEFRLLAEKLQSVSGNSAVSAVSIFENFEVTEDNFIQSALEDLRQRPLKVVIDGQVDVLGPQESRLDIQLNSAGSFYIEHSARGKHLKRSRGFSRRTEKYLLSLNEGLAFFMGTQARDLASSHRAKRDWDVRLLKHAGLLQYVFFEFLSMYFTGKDSEGRDAEPGRLIESIKDRLTWLLTTSADVHVQGDSKIDELCSRSVLMCLEEFIAQAQKDIQQSESFYSEFGETVLKGAIEKEWKILYLLLKNLTLSTQGECFRKSRSAFLNRISDYDKKERPELRNSRYYFYYQPNQHSSGLSVALQSLQELQGGAYKIFYENQPLQELDENDFRANFQISTQNDETGINWFELNPDFFLMGESTAAENFLKLGQGGVVEYKGQYYLIPQKHLPSLRLLQNFWQRLQKAQKNTSGRKRLSDQVFTLPKHQVLELLALRASGVNMAGDKEWQELCRFYDNLGQKINQQSLPTSTAERLKSYQRDGLGWLHDLYRLKLGALLADDMGLGKTLQTLSFLDLLRERNELKKVLIVVPTSLIFNWQQEVLKFTPDLPLSIFNSRSRDLAQAELQKSSPTVMLTTYGLLMEHESFFSQFNWQILVLDEAQNLKNITAKRTSSARALTAQFKIALTGTPMENHYGEFFSLMDLLVPGCLGGVDEFRQQFVNRERVQPESLKYLKAKIKPLILRRTKKEILSQLPEKQESSVSIAFEEEQKKIYRDIAVAHNERIQQALSQQEGAESSQVQLQMLTALLRLRQVCSDPAALPNIQYNKTPPKIETLTESLSELVQAGESALVFTQFLQTLQHVASHLKKNNIPVFVIHGGVPTAQRQKVLAQFADHLGGAVLVMTLKTGGVGLNLTKASYVFHLEPWWNPAVENQATDRAHRLGQTKAVQVFRYIMHESLEEKIELLKARKDLKFRALLGDSDQSQAETSENLSPAVGKTAALTKEDFDLLLGL